MLNHIFLSEGNAEAGFFDNIFLNKLNTLYDNSDLDIANISQFVKFETSDDFFNFLEELENSCLFTSCEDYIRIESGFWEDGYFILKSSSYIDSEQDFPTASRIRIKVVAHKNKIPEYRDRMASILDPFVDKTPGLCDISWYFCKGSEMNHMAQVCSFDEVYLDEAYPQVYDGISDFTDRYLASDSSVLVLYGSPGTGKTRFIRAMLRSMAITRNSPLGVMYSTDQNILENEQFILQFVTGRDRVMVLEDVDHNLLPRSQGNPVMASILNGADGVIPNRRKKLIISTNLPTMGKADEALLRKGRCFGTIKFRALNKDEAQRLLVALNQQSVKLPEDQQEFTLADIYELVNSNQ